MTSLAPYRPHTVPTAKAVRDVIADLLGREVDVLPGDPVVATTRKPALVAVYVDDSTRLAAAACMDLPLTAYVGAALGLVPVAGAQEAVEAGAVPESILENTVEVLNVMASLFNVGEAPHLRLYSHTAPGATPPADVAVITRALGRRLDLKASVQEYGEGGISVVLA